VALWTALFGLLDRCDEVHFVLAMTRRLGVFIVGRRHADFSTADRAPEHDLDLAQLAGRRRFRQRCREGLQEPQSGFHDHHAEQNGQDYVEDGSHVASLDLSRLDRMVGATVLGQESAHGGTEAMVVETLLVASNAEVDLALLIVRIGIGLTLAAHGWAKFFTGGRIAGTAGWFDSMGMRPGKVHAVLAAGGEIAAGVFMALGLLTSFAALGFVGLMTVAWWTVHRDSGFFIIKEGWEYVFILALVAVTVAMIGPGDWSLDAAIGLADNFDGYVGLLISALGGVVAAAALLAAFFRPPPAEAG